MEQFHYICQLENSKKVTSASQWDRVAKLRIIHLPEMTKN